MDIYNFTCIYSDYTYKYSSMNESIVHIFSKRLHLHSFKCCIQLKAEKIWKN